MWYNIYMEKNNAPYLERTNKGTSFIGSDVYIFAALVCASGLRMYAKTGMKPNAAYTPTAMLKSATLYTGKAYKRGQFEEAAQDLTDYAEALKSQARADYTDASRAKSAPSK